MTQGEGIVLGAFIGGLFGLFPALLAWKQMKRKLADDLLFTALDFLGGGRQKRNLGIAAISRYWRLCGHTELCVEMLIGSAIYLLRESEGKNKEHEIYNLYRIMDLLNEMKRKSHKLERYEDLEKVLDSLIQNYSPKPQRGLWVPKEKLETWKTNLKDVPDHMPKKPDLCRLAQAVIEKLDDPVSLSEDEDYGEVLLDSTNVRAEFNFREQTKIYDKAEKIKNERLEEKSQLEERLVAVKKSINFLEELMKTFNGKESASQTDA